jgi:hypothetical protein
MRSTLDLGHTTAALLALNHSSASGDTAITTRDSPLHRSLANDRPDGIEQVFGENVLQEDKEWFAIACPNYPTVLPNYPIPRCGWSNTKQHAVVPIVQLLPA